MTYQFSFKDCLARSERITWRVEDLIGGDKKLDFARPFMPENLARTRGLSFLDADERCTLNQIRGHAYLAIFGIVEEFILPFVLEHARPFLTGDDYRARAYLEFASEEAKHIQLFRTFRNEFAKGFSTECQVIGPPDAISAHILGQPPLAVALLTLQIEWMTQRHYQESVRDDNGLDPLFKDLLVHHWMEELQHAQLDANMVQAIAETMSKAEVEAGIDAYLAIGGFFDEGLKQQTLFDMEALQRATGRTLNSDERAQFQSVQHQANRWTYLGSGMSHPLFLAALERLSPTKREMIEKLAPDFS